MGYALQAVALLRQYGRWPAWMWGNYEIASSVTWLNHQDQTKPGEDKIGFFGLYVYSLLESMQELMPYIQNNGAVLLKP